MDSLVECPKRRALATAPLVSYALEALAVVCNTINQSINLDKYQKCMQGPSGDARVRLLRARQMRNMLVALLLSHGVPMLLMGDEYGHTKGGNNNTYCHDSPLNYLNWAQADHDSVGLTRFTRCLIKLRCGLGVDGQGVGCG